MTDAANADDRLEQIRQVEEEIDWLNDALAFPRDARDNPTIERILDARKAVLADLRRGMREGDKG